MASTSWGGRMGVDKKLKLTRYLFAPQQGLIAAVPSGENPWLAILAELQSQVEWNLDDSFRIQMWILSGLLVIPPV